MQARACLAEREWDDEKPHAGSGRTATAFEDWPGGSELGAERHAAGGRVVGGCYFSQCAHVGAVGKRHDRYRTRDVRAGGTESWTYAVPRCDLPIRPFDSVLECAAVPDVWDATERAVLDGYCGGAGDCDVAVSNWPPVHAARVCVCRLRGLPARSVRAQARFQLSDAVQFSGDLQFTGDGSAGISGDSSNPIEIANHGVLGSGYERGGLAY